MSILLQKILGKCNYMTYYYSIQTLSDPNAKYDLVYGEGRLTIGNFEDYKRVSMKSVMPNNMFMGQMFANNICVFENIFKNLEFMIIPDKLQSQHFYKNICRLEKLNTLVVIDPNNEKAIDILRHLPIGLKTLILEDVNSDNVKYFDNLPITLEKVIFIHLLDKYEKSKEIFKNMKLPFDTTVMHLVKKNKITTAVYEYEKILKKHTHFFKQHK